MMRRAMKHDWNQPAPSAAPGLRYIFAGFGGAWLAAAMVLIISG